MNEITHFLSGYLLARAMKYDADRYEAFYLGLAAILPDIDSIIGIFLPFEHGVLTHTYLGGMVLVLALAAISFACVAPLLKRSGTTFPRLLWLGFLGLSLHFLLDSFTFHYGSCSRWLNPAVWEAGCVCPGPDCVSVDDRHHLFFWPLWDFPPHINTLFPYPGVTFAVRVWVEVVVTTILALIVLWRWLGKRDNVWGVFLPSAWWASVHSPSGNPEPPEVHTPEKPRVCKKRSLFRPALSLFKTVPRSILAYWVGVIVVVVLYIFA